MDAERRKAESSLPPDYVSLAQLQKLWLQKQEEKKLKQKQKEEDQDPYTPSPIGDPDQFVYAIDCQEQTPPERHGNASCVGHEGEGKATGHCAEVVVEDMVPKAKKKKKKWKKRAVSEKKPVALGNDGRYRTGKGNAGEHGLDQADIALSCAVKEGGSRTLNARNSGRPLREPKETEELACLAVTSVLPMDAESERNVGENKRRTGRHFSKRGHTRGSGYGIRREYRVKLDGLKQTWVESSSKLENKNALRADTSDVKEVETKAEKETEFRISAICEEMHHLSTGENSNISELDGCGRKAIGSSVALEEEEQDKLSGLKVESCHEKGRVGNEYRRHWNFEFGGDKVGKEGGYCNSTSRYQRASNIRPQRNYDYDRRGSANWGKFGMRWNSQRSQRSSHLQWIKKGENLSAEAASAGSYGVSADQD